MASAMMFFVNSFLLLLWEYLSVRASTDCIVGVVYCGPFMTNWPADNRVTKTFVYLILRYITYIVIRYMEKTDLFIRCIFYFLHFVKTDVYVFANDL